MPYNTCLECCDAQCDYYSEWICPISSEKVIEMTSCPIDTYSKGM